ncbi:MAG: 50S ribosomal protein L24 [Candidatus Shikimatogenerans bostrichidophilus]|nr:MAG: 50S ribosomal protein L24 [Candidatus Shikimatogenerans bostrichidophilus]
MLKLKLKKGDKVKIITGKYKGKIGNILKVLRKTKKIYVKGINIVKKHIKKKDNNNIGKIYFKESIIDISNVSIIDPKIGCISKIGIKYYKNKKVRYCKKTNNILKDNILYKKKK